MVYCFLLGGLCRPAGTATNIKTRAVCLSRSWWHHKLQASLRASNHHTHIHGLITFRTKILLTAASIENNSFICHTETLNRSEIICPFFETHFPHTWTVGISLWNFTGQKDRQFQLDAFLLTTINTRRVFSLFVKPRVHINISFDWLARHYIIFAVITLASLPSSVLMRFLQNDGMVFLFLLSKQCIKITHN